MTQMRTRSNPTRDTQKIRTKQENRYKTHKIEKSWTPTTKEEEEDTQDVDVDEAEASVKDGEDMAEEPEVFQKVKKEK